jgi:hypothetical protein
MDDKMITERRVPIAPGKTRKTLTLPRELIARVRTFRFARQIDQESDAYVWLLERGLEAATAEQTKVGKPRTEKK